MEDTLGSFLGKQLDRLGLSKKELAHRLGISQSYLTRLLADARAPNVDEARLQEWATRLRLGKAERQELYELLQLANSPPYVRALVAKLRAQLRASARRSAPPKQP